MGKHWVKTSLGLGLLLTGQYFFFTWFTSSPIRVENIYSNGIYPIIGKCLRMLFGWVPFPVGQLFLIGVICVSTIFLLRSLIRVIRKQIKWIDLGKNSLINVLICGNVIYFLFMSVWGINYKRLPLLTHFHFKQTSYSVSELTDLCEVLVLQCNQVRAGIKNPQLIKQSNTDLFQRASFAYKNYSDQDSLINYAIPSTKAVMVSSSMAISGISGIYFPFTGEANVNMEAPMHELPFTICHEIGHQMGIAKEEEANFISFMVCTSSSDSVFLYSALRSALRYSMYTLLENDDIAFDHIRTMYGKQMKGDILKSRAYWEQYQGPISNYSEGINDLYLKANAQENGVESYDLFVDLLIAAHRNKQGIFENISSK